MKSKIFKMKSKF